MNLEQFKKEKKKLCKVLETSGRQILVDEFKKFFAKFPHATAVRWDQYTPHFNDGDVCEFDRNEFDLKGTFAEALVSGQKMDDDGFYTSWTIDSNSELGDAVEYLDGVFEGTNDVFETAFGDGVQVVATASGFTVEDYDHD